MMLLKMVLCISVLLFIIASAIIIKLSALDLLLELLVSLYRTRKRRKNYEENDNILGEDLISALPDDILVSIIERTPIKACVSSSILSKRWRNLYKSMPHFKLECKNLLKNHHFNHNYDVNSILATHRLETFLTLICSSNIKTNYDFTCCFHSVSAVERCISYIRKSSLVDELTLRLNCRTDRTDCPFPCRLLSKLPPSLKFLNLGVCTLQPYKFKTSKCSFLQTLQLEDVVLDQPSMDCILSISFNLVSLLIRRSICPKKLCIRGGGGGADLKLETLTISHCCYLEEMDLFAPNLTTLDIKDSNIKIHKVGFDYVPRLQNLHISVSEINSVLSYVSGQLHKDLPCLKWLNFRTALSVGFNYDQEGKFLNLFHTFTQLKRLDMNVFRRIGSSLLVLAPFLESCPLLEEFHLHIERSKNYVVKDVRKSQLPVLHRKLKKVEITGFSGTDNEIEFASYILSSAVALEQMFIIRCEFYYEECTKKWFTLRMDPWSEDTRVMIQERLMQHQAHSSSCTTHLIIQHNSSFIPS